MKIDWHRYLQKNTKLKQIFLKPGSLQLLILCKLSVRFYGCFLKRLRKEKLRAMVTTFYWTWKHWMRGKAHK